MFLNNILTTYGGLNGMMIAFAIIGLVVLGLNFLIRRMGHIHKQGTKYFLKSIVFVLIGVFIYGLVNTTMTLKRSDGIMDMWSFYQQQENTVDILLLGSSNTGMNLDVAELWDNYGFSAYALWGSVQPFWNSYYFLKEALKTQEPEVVVLDVAAVRYSFEYSDDARQAANTSGIRFSFNRLAAVMVSAPAERWVDLFWGLPVFHSRYTELTKDDFSYFGWSKGLEENKGTGYRYGTNNSFAVSDVSEITETAEIPEKEETWLRNIIELCQQKDLPIVLCKTPVVDRESAQPYWNAVQKIADEYGIVFYNFALYDEETGFEISDYWTDGAHLNTSGARKISDYLGKLLVETYQLQDHRGDSTYDSWDIFSEEISNSYLKEITDVTDYTDELTRKDRTIIFAVNGTWEQTDGYNEIMDHLSQFGLSDDISIDGNGLYVCPSSMNCGIEKVSDSLENIQTEINSIPIEVTDGKLFIDGTNVCEFTDSGLWCIVVDTDTGECIDSVNFLQSNDFALQHQ